MVQCRKTKQHKALLRVLEWHVLKGGGDITDHSSRDPKERKKIAESTSQRTYIPNRPWKEVRWDLPEGRGSIFLRRFLKTWMKIAHIEARKKSTSEWSRRSRWEGAKYKIDFIRESRDRGSGYQEFEFDPTYNVEMLVITQERKWLGKLICRVN